MALGDARLAYVSKISQLEALRALEAAREGYGAGVRAVFGAGGELAGVRGSVADLLDVPPGLERAVEAVLGERLQWVVVERFEHARAAVQQLRDQFAGAATFLPLDRLATNGGGTAALEGAGWAMDQVSGASRPLLAYLL